MSTDRSNVRNSVLYICFRSTNRSSVREKFSLDVGNGRPPGWPANPTVIFLIVGGWSHGQPTGHSSLWLCNTPLPEYILSCVFRFFDRIFRFTSCICFVLWIIYMIVLPWIQIRELRVGLSLNRGPDPRGISWFGLSGIQMWAISVSNNVF